MRQFELLTTATASGSLVSAMSFYAGTLLVLLFAFFSLAHAEGVPVGFQTTTPDPFTDRFMIRITGEGKHGNLRLSGYCDGLSDDYRYRLSFSFLEKGYRTMTPHEADKEMFFGRYGTADYRFDKGLIESFRFTTNIDRNMINLDQWRMGVGLWDHINHGEAIVKRFPQHRRLRVRMLARHDNDIYRRVVDDFDISQVTEKTLDDLCRCEKDPDACNGQR